jgi:hypothetical protein
VHRECPGADKLPVTSHAKSLPVSISLLRNPGLFLSLQQ